MLYLWRVQGGHSVFVNRALVVNGFAKASLYEPNDLYIDVMYTAEREARAADRGLWGCCPRFGAPLNTPEPPAPDPPSGGGGGNCDQNYSGACIRPYRPSWPPVLHRLGTSVSRGACHIRCREAGTADVLRAGACVYAGRIEADHAVLAEPVALESRLPRCRTESDDNSPL